ncbi:MAG TPA: F-box protein, partial [Ramlibacter sp.]|nr:F-box protein [Ramlibacter sp.]
MKRPRVEHRTALDIALVDGCAPAFSGVGRQWRPIREPSGEQHFEDEEAWLAAVEVHDRIIAEATRRITEHVAAVAPIAEQLDEAIGLRNWLIMKATIAEAPQRATPVDVLPQIAVGLCARDLVRVASTCKLWRRMLSGRAVAREIIEGWAALYRVDMWLHLDALSHKDFSDELGSEHATKMCFKLLVHAWSHVTLHGEGAPAPLVRNVLDPVISQNGLLVKRPDKVVAVMHRTVDCHHIGEPRTYHHVYYREHVIQPWQRGEPAIQSWQRDQPAVMEGTFVHTRT